MTDNTMQKCHICGTENPSHARFCHQCGAALTPPTTDTAPPTPQTHYDYHFGESDLLETEMTWRTGWHIISLAMIVTLALIGLLGYSLLTSVQAPDTPVPPTANNLASSPAVAVDDSTPTPRPTLNLATVTPAPPTATPTPTEGPCERQVQSYDTLIGIISACGHRDLDVLDEVLELNELNDASAIRLGQTIYVPRPTPTPNPNAPAEATEAEDVNTNSNNSFTDLLFADGAEGLPTFTPSPQPTLPPGVMWHTVIKDETIIGVVNRYNAGVEILSQLNPEITFAQCEFTPEMPYGGPSCTVFLIEGMRMRVPAPTPTPTLSPTPSGNETPTPLPTATFNAPYLVSPGDRVIFQSNELVTLRWSGTGTLGPDEVYRAHVQNTSTGLSYQLDVRGTFMVLPIEWQEQDSERHDYQWHIEIIDTTNPTLPRYTTESRVFTWEGAIEATNEEE